jgi:hypothetical protein
MSRKTKATRDRMTKAIVGDILQTWPRPAGVSRLKWWWLRTELLVRPMPGYVAFGSAGDTARWWDEERVRVEAVATEMRALINREDVG